MTCLTGELVSRAFPSHCGRPLDGSMLTFSVGKGSFNGYIE
jgi:predicted aconitase with swiveling domain